MIQPAQGEGAAVGGYDYQYRSSATLVLRALLDGSLRWITIKDVDAGRVDDFVLGRDNRVDGYQFKHRATGTFTFGNLTKEELIATGGNDSARRHPALIKQLADGWNALKG